MVELFNSNCLEKIKDIPDNSIDLIVTDPPYNIGKAHWDKIQNYVKWCGIWLKESERVLKNNGTLYFFHNDMPQIAQLIEWIKLNTDFKYNSFIIWDKGEHRANCWKYPTEKNTLRSWFSTCEYCLAYTFQDQSGLDRIKLDTNNFQTLRRYAYQVLCYIGGGQSVSNQHIQKALGHRRAEHFFYCLPKEYP